MSKRILDYAKWGFSATVGGILVDGWLIGGRLEKKRADELPGKTTFLERVHQTPRSDHGDRISVAGLTFGAYPGVFWTRPLWKTEGILKTLAEFLNFGLTQDYWNEEAAYKVTSAGMWQVESAAYELHSMCLEAVDEIVDSDELLEQFSIPVHLWEAVRYSWTNSQSDLSGRIDLLWDGESPPKLAEYNADTPTVLVESASAQRQWQRDVHPTKGQFNVLDEALVAAFETMKEEDRIERGRFHQFNLIFTAQRGKNQVGSIEERGTAVIMAKAAQAAKVLSNTSTAVEFVEERSTAMYMMQAAQAAGVPSAFVDLEEFEKPEVMKSVLQAGATHNAFAKSIAIWKLYPYEWLIDESLGRALQPPCLEGHLRWIEPPWKLILSSKAILPYLWQKHPNHPNLLPAFYSSEALHSAVSTENSWETTDFVGKPRFGREGVGIKYTNCEVSRFQNLREFSDAAEAAAEAPPPLLPFQEEASAQAEGITNGLSESASRAVSKLREFTGDQVSVNHLLDHAYGSGARIGDHGAEGSKGVSEQTHPERDSSHHLGPPIFQQYHAPAVLHGRTVVTSAWVVRGAPAAACFREDNGTTTNNDSCFVPHFVCDGDLNGNADENRAGAQRAFPLTEKQRELRIRLYGKDPLMALVPESSQVDAPSDSSGTSIRRRSNGSGYYNGGGLGYSPVGGGGARASSSTSSSSSWFGWKKKASSSSGKSSSSSSHGSSTRPPPPVSNESQKVKVGKGVPRAKWSPGRSTGSMGHAYSSSGRSSGGGRG